MEYMRSGKHVGKLVLVNGEVDERGNTNPVCVRAKLPITAIRPDGLYLVTGGAGGFGSQIVNHIASLGARHIVVTVTRDPR
jgi:NADPH:quinone reductase-like Zn-dependent oxidoreductase